MRVLRVLAALALFACGAPPEPVKPASPIGDAGAAAAAPSATTSSASSALVTTPAEIDPFARVRADLDACYEEGKRAVPTMTSGKITLHASVEADGHASCVVPSDDTGLTQDVERCMLARVAKATFAKSAAPSSVVIPVALKDGKLERGVMKETPPAIETVESQGLAEDVYDVVEALLPDLYACVKGIAKTSNLRVVHVGGRVGANGAVECALASAPSSVPPEARACAANVLARAKFRAPKKGSGLVSVPLLLSKT